MRFFKAPIVSVIMFIVSLFVGAVVLGILNIYLSGHGIDWPDQDFETGPTGMSPLSLALAVFTSLIAVTSFVVTFILLPGKAEKPDS